MIHECPECGGYYHRHEDTIDGIPVEYYVCHDCGDEVWLDDDEEYFEDEPKHTGFYLHTDVGTAHVLGDSNMSRGVSRVDQMRGTSD